MADINEVLDEIVRRIVEAVHPDKIILFGSHARGEAREDSDIDLLVIAPTDQPRGSRMMPIYRALRGIPVPKDVLWYTPEEAAKWEGGLIHVVARALREGKVLYAS
ncbi:MAG: nucleotidyltransferase domain-containing protein [Armatimonadia bacterium]